MKRIFRKTNKKKRQKLASSLSPPTQEMLDLGLAAAMHSKNIRVIESDDNNDDDHNNEIHNNPCGTKIEEEEEMNSNSEMQNEIRMLKAEVVKLNGELEQRDKLITSWNTEATATEIEEAEEEEEEVNPLQSVTIDDFINNFRYSCSEFFSTAYQMKRTIHKSNLHGTLSTSLSEDVFALVDAQCSLLHDYLTSIELMGTEVGNSLLIEALLSILQNLRLKQNLFRNSFLLDYRSCIAAANDFSRLGDRVEELQQSLIERYPHLEWEGDDETNVTFVFRREATILLDALDWDAAHAANRIASFVISGLHRSGISSELFSHDWEDKYVQNEVAVSMVRIFERYLSEICNSIEQEYVYNKVVASLVRCTVCFYVLCFVKKADNMKQAMKCLASKRKVGDHAFLSATRAICRMNYDVQVLREYFINNTARESIPLERIIVNEFSVLVLLMECMCLAVGETNVNDSLEEFIVVVHKKFGADSVVTRQFLSDLWVLCGPKNQHRHVEKTVRMMDTDLQLVSKQMKEERRLTTTTAATTASSTDVSANNEIACLRLDETLKSLYEDRILQEQSSLCGNLILDIKNLRGM